MMKVLEEKEAKGDTPAKDQSQKCKARQIK